MLSDDPDLAAAAADAFESMGALLYAAEAVALEQRRSLEAGLARRASAAAARAARLVERCESPLTPALRVEIEVDPLSSREREIALLAAEGRTSREIADQLYLSVRTVDNHLQRAYTKLGVAGRNQL